MRRPLRGLVGRRKSNVRQVIVPIGKRKSNVRQAMVPRE